MRYFISLPARINLLGNPADANEGDFAVLSSAIHLRAEGWAAPAGEVSLRLCTSNGGECLEQASFLTGTFPLPYDGDLNLLKGAINRLYTFSPEFREKYTRQGISLAGWTQVPRQSGLGGSTLFILLALAGLRQVYQLDRSFHNDYVLSELAQRVESLELGIACGFADRYVPVFGGLAYIDYRGKLHQAPVGEEPLAVYERLEAYVPELPLVAVCTGVMHDSGDVHGRMRPRYLAEYDDWLPRGGPPPPMVRYMSAAWETAWRGKHALLRGDLTTVGKLMNTNHHLVDEMMSYCGFEDGAGWANNHFIRLARENGALGAKLTGAGGGGSVFALVQPGDEPRLLEVWEQAAEEAKLTDAYIYRPRLSVEGLIVREEA